MQHFDPDVNRIVHPDAVKYQLGFRGRQMLRDESLQSVTYAINSLHSLGRYDGLCLSRIASGSQCRSFGIWGGQSTIKVSGE
jgi:hypothetical protein